MKTAKTTTKPFATAIALLVAGVLWFAWGSRQAQAIQDSEDFPSPIGITNGQTARLSVLNTGEKRGIIINGSFLDSQGRTISETPEPHLLLPGQMRTFDLNADNINASIGSFGRIQVLALVRAIGNPDTKNLHVSLEVMTTPPARRRSSSLRLSSRVSTLSRIRRATRGNLLRSAG